MYLQQVDVVEAGLRFKLGVGLATQPTASVSGSATTDAALIDATLGRGSQSANSSSIKTHCQTSNGYPIEH